MNIKVKWTEDLGRLNYEGNLVQFIIGRDGEPYGIVQLGSRFVTVLYRYLEVK